MNKKYILRKNEDIQLVIKNNQKIIDKYFIIYYKDNKMEYNRYCISVSKKIGKAHVRNLLKRRMKDILMKNNIDNSNDYVIILRNGIMNLSYLKMKDIIINILKGEK